MIIQGTNNPIRLVFDSIPTDVSISLVNEIQTLEHWGLEDLTASDDMLEYTAPFTQEMSMAWEEGPCTIIVRWTSADGEVHIARHRDVIEYVHDRTILNTE